MPFINDVTTYYDRYHNDSNIRSFLYFYKSFYLVEDNKLYSAIYLLNKTLSLIEDKNYELKCACLHNSGMLNYALGNSLDGIHELEDAYRLNITHNLSTKTLLHLQYHLALAYIDQKRFSTAFALLQQSIGARSLKYNENNINESVRLKLYINFIIDYIEYEFTLYKKNKMWNKADIPHKNSFNYENESENLIDYVLSNLNDEKQVIEFYSDGMVLFLFRFC